MKMTKEQYLIHSTTNDSQWRKSCWQNRDGSLTPIGKNRYGYRGDSKKPTNNTER